MSSKGRKRVVSPIVDLMIANSVGTTKIEADKYYTPTVCTSSLLPLINFRYGMTFLEPCDGIGSISDIVKFYTNIMIGYPVTPTTYELDRGEDYLSIPSPSKQYDICITNPPYTKALEFLDKTLVECKTVIMLLRLNFIGSQKRMSWFRQHPPNNQIVLSTRPSFVSVCKVCGNAYHNNRMVQCCDKHLTKTTDSTEYAWFCWGDKEVLPEQPFLWV